MKMRLVAASLALAIVIPASLVFAQRVIDDKGFVTLELGKEEWTEYPGIQGVKRMVVEGDPSKPGPYVIRVKFSPGTMSMPHFHPEDRLVTVLKGTWYTGKGKSFEPGSTEPLTPGSYMKHPAGEAHYDGAKDEEVILQIAGMGPSGTTFFQPELGPTGKSR